MKSRSHEIGSLKYHFKIWEVHRSQYRKDACQNFRATWQFYIYIQRRPDFERAYGKTYCWILKSLWLCRNLMRRISHSFFDVFECVSIKLNSLCWFEHKYVFTNAMNVAFFFRPQPSDFFVFRVIYRDYFLKNISSFMDARPLISSGSWYIEILKN